MGDDSGEVRRVQQSGSWESAVLDALPVAVVVSDERGFRHANAAAARLFRTSPEELVGRPFDHVRGAGFTALDDRGERITDAGSGTAQVLRTGRAVSGRLRLVGPDGSVQWLAHTSSPIELDGRPAVLTVVQDLSLHRAMEDELLASQRRLQDIIDAVPSSVFVKDRAGRYTFVNGQFLRETGLTAGDVLGRTARELPGGRSSSRLSEQDESVLDQGVARTVVDDYGTDDQRRSFLIAKVPLRDAAGAVVGLTGVSTDITDQVRAAEDSARLAAVVRATSDAVLTVDLDMRITSCNGGAERLLGRSADQLRGRPYLDVTTADPADVRHVLARALAGSEVRDVELSSVRPDGSGATKVGSAYPVRAADGQVTGAALVLRDVTRERRADAERVELQRRVEQKQRLESLGALAGGVAHDFNNVLAAVNLTAEAVARRLAPDSEDRRDVESIATIAQRGADLTRQMSVFARGRPRRQDVVDLNDAVRAADRLLHRTLGEHVRRVQILSGAPCLVRGDLGELEQVVVNLATNARDAMPDGGVLTIETAVTALSGVDLAGLHLVSERGTQHVLLTVTDDGTGMPSEVADHAFEPFFTTKALGVGTGLGLAMVFGVADQAGGGAQIRSEPGRGTTVQVAWPAAGVVPRLATDAALEPEPGPGQGGGGARLVLVEDEPALRTAMVRVLNDGGYVVEAHADGASAHAALLAWGEPPALLVSDVVLPGLTGPALADAARERYPGLPVLLVSGYTGDLLGSRSRDEVDLLEKPFDSRTLLAAVRRACRPR